MTGCDGWCKIHVQSESSSWPESNGLNYSAVFLLSDSNEKQSAPTPLKKSMKVCVCLCVYVCVVGGWAACQVVHLHCQPLYFENTAMCDIFIYCLKFLGWGELRGLSRRLWSIIIKGIVHPKMEICWKSTHSQPIQDVDEFVSSSEQIWRNVSSEMDPLQWMDAVRMRVQTADKNIVIHTNPS